MDGRIQREILIETKIEKMLQSQPDYIKDFYEWMNGKSVTTKESYVRYVIHFMEFCAEELGVDTVDREDLNKISLGTLNRYTRNISAKVVDGKVVDYNSESIVNTKICAVSTFFRFLEYSDLVGKNPCEKVTRPIVQEKESITYLTPEEINEVMTNIESGTGKDAKWKYRDKFFMSLLLVTGMRISALVDINIEDIDMETRILTVVEKERKRRQFKLPSDIMGLLNEWLRMRTEIIRMNGGENEALLITVYGGKCKRITTKTINNLIKKYTSTINKHITAHKLRATFAVTTYDDTGDIYLVSELLGHKSPEVTRRYVRVSEQKKEKALENMSKRIGI